MGASRADSEVFGSIFLMEGEKAEQGSGNGSGVLGRLEGGEAVTEHLSHCWPGVRPGLIILPLPPTVFPPK